MYAAALLLALSVTSARGVEDWRPVGQGDPLRDPTHVYSPPQVAHVHYWLKSPSIALEPPPSRIVGLSQVAGWPQVTAHYLGNNANQPSSTTPVSITTAYPDVFQYQIIKSPHSSPFVEKNSIHGPSHDLPIFVKPNVPDPSPPFFPTSSSSRPVKFFTSPPPNKPFVFHSSYRTTNSPQTVSFTSASQPVPFTTVPQPVSFTTASPATVHKGPPLAVTTDNFAAPSFNSWAHDVSSSSPPVVKQISTTVVYDTTTTQPTSSTTTTPRPLNFVIEGHSKVKKYGPLPESSTSIHRVTHNHLITNLISKDEKDDLDKFNPFRL
uniref:Uncharacterized protein n=1 Tax=Lygus hesperus TaxID=30085 RepID=A0A0A9W7T2_LYGHE